MWIDLQWQEQLNLKKKNLNSESQTLERVPLMKTQKSAFMHMNERADIVQWTVLH